MPKGIIPSQGSSATYKEPNFFQKLVGYDPNTGIGPNNPDVQNNVNNLVNPIVDTFNKAVGKTPFNSPPAYAQVSGEDTGMDDFAARHGADLQTVVNLNGTKTLPPKGSYLQLINQGVPPSVAASISGGGLPGANANRPATMTSQGRGGEGIFRLRTQANQIMQQWKTTGVDPVSIPSAVLGLIKNANGEPLTIQKALEMGYVMNENGILVKQGTPGAPGPQSGNNWETNPALHVVTWNRNAKNWKSRFKTTEKWAANAMRRKRRGGGDARPAGQTAREGPSSILDIHLGSG